MDCTFLTWWEKKLLTHSLLNLYFPGNHYYKRHECYEEIPQELFYFDSHLNFHIVFVFFYLFRESASPSTWVRPVSRQEMPAGSSSASSTASVLTASSWTVPHNRTLVTTRSTPSSTPGALDVTSPERYMWTWSPLWLVSSPVCVCLFLPSLSLFFLLSFQPFYYEWPCGSTSTQFMQVTADGWEHWYLSNKCSGDSSTFCSILPNIYRGVLCK